MQLFISLLVSFFILLVPGSAVEKNDGGGIWTPEAIDYVSYEDNTPPACGETKVVQKGALCQETLMQSFQVMLCQTYVTTCSKDCYEEQDKDGNVTYVESTNCDQEMGPWLLSPTA